MNTQPRSSRAHSVSSGYGSASSSTVSPPPARVATHSRRRCHAAVRVGDQEYIRAEATGVMRLKPRSGLDGILSILNGSAAYRDRRTSRGSRSRSASALALPPASRTSCAHPPLTGCKRREDNGLPIPVGGGSEHEASPASSRRMRLPARPSLLAEVGRRPRENAPPLVGLP